ncbi:MAG: aldehyde dehydrogenase family protein, partial [Gemmatimonadales bacterium]
MSFRAVNPSTGAVIREVESCSLEDARAAADATRDAFESWRRTPFPHRAARLAAAAGILRERAHDLARLMAQEMGKPLAQGRSEAEKCAWVLDYYAEGGAEFLKDEPVQLDEARAYWSYQPLGTVLAIMPWNFPLWQVFRAAAPTLMAGNAVLLKHAPNVPGCAAACEEIFHEAGIPEELFANLYLEVDHIPALLEHPAIQAVTLTGSVRAGKAVAAQAGALVKKCVLELGGSDPYVVLS